MKMDEKVLDILIDKLTDIGLPKVDIIEIIISNITNKITEKGNTYEMDIKLRLKEKTKPKATVNL